MPNLQTRNKRWTFFAPAKVKDEEIRLAFPDNRRPSIRLLTCFIQEIDETQEGQDSLAATLIDRCHQFEPFLRRRWSMRGCNRP
jgi:hypothetical protein